MSWLSRSWSRFRGAPKQSDFRSLHLLLGGRSLDHPSAARILAEANRLLPIRQIMIVAVVIQADGSEGLTAFWSEMSAERRAWMQHRLDAEIQESEQ